MENQKIGNLLNLAMESTEKEREESLELNVGYEAEDERWNVIVKYSGNFDDLKDEGVRICNWGGMLHDISNGTIEVPGAALPYSRSSFVVSKDDHHENLLAGYITTLMVYCAITGESPVGQPYDFCDNKELNTMFDLEAFKTKNYPDNGQTNFVEIFRSEADMLGLQQLAEQYLKDFN